MFALAYIIQGIIGAASSATLQDLIISMIKRGVCPISGYDGGGFTQAPVAVGDPVPDTLIPLLVMGGDFDPMVQHGCTYLTADGGNLQHLGIQWEFNSLGEVEISFPAQGPSGSRWETWRVIGNDVWRWDDQARLDLDSFLLPEKTFAFAFGQSMIIAISREKGITTISLSEEEFLEEVRGDEVLIGTFMSGGVLKVRTVQI